MKGLVIFALILSLCLHTVVSRNVSFHFPKRNIWLVNSNDIWILSGRLPWLCWGYHWSCRVLSGIILSSGFMIIYLWTFISFAEKKYWSLSISADYLFDNSCFIRFILQTTLNKAILNRLFSISQFELFF